VRLRALRRGEGLWLLLSMLLRRLLLLYLAFIGALEHKVP
jgi:hypothetical protein